MKERSMIKANTIISHCSFDYVIVTLYMKKNYLKVLLSQYIYYIFMVSITEFLYN